MDFELIKNKYLKKYLDYFLSIRLIAKEITIILSTMPQDSCQLV